MTKIQWTDTTWNPVTGCSRVSAGCEHCYAERLATGRLKGSKGYPGLPWTAQNAATNVVLHPDRIEEPLRWRKPRRVFVNSMSDLFHELIPDPFLDRVFAVMALTPQHQYQVLTKRPARMRDYISPAVREMLVDSAAIATLNKAFDWKWPLGNVWLGTSVEEQRWTSRIDALRETPAAVRFLSIEPQIEEIRGLDLRGIDWVIVGGESGPGARPFNLDWARSIRDECRAAGIAFFLKQLGARPSVALYDWRGNPTGQLRHEPLRDSHGGDPAEWPEDLRVREWPEPPVEQRA